jgi:carbamoyl-phosphate synthase large subunit
MKSVGEIMAIGRTFEEAIQKGIRMVGEGMHGFVSNHDLGMDEEALETELQKPTDKRIFAISEAMQRGYTVEDIYQMTKIDRWFLQKLQNIIDIKDDLYKNNALTEMSDELLLRSKQLGFSDFQIAREVIKPVGFEISEDLLKVRAYRKSRNILPYVKQIDTLGGEYPAQTNYLYMTYSGSEHDVEFINDNNSAVVLGSGAYRIGSSVEFDWCSVTAIKTVHEQGMRSIMINYNPETVSTDYDMCDRLYFDELTLERPYLRNSSYYD